MATIFKNAPDLSDSYRLQVKRLWLEIFCEDLNSLQAGKIEEKMGMLDNTLVAIRTTKGKRKIIAMSFLLLPTQKDYEKKVNHTYYSNVKQQGVKANKDVYLYNFCVREQDRRKGNSKKLMTAIEKEMMGRGRDRIVLFVETGNIAAIALYNNIGYTVTRAAPSGFLMEKKLKNG